MLFDMKINYDAFVRKFISDWRLLWFAGSNSMWKLPLECHVRYNIKYVGQI